VLTKSDKGHIHIITLIVTLVFVFGLWSLYNSYRTHRLKHDLVLMLEDCKAIALSMAGEDEQTKKGIANLFGFMQKAIENGDRSTFRSAFEIAYQKLSELPQNEQVGNLKQRLQKVQEESEQHIFY